jgi:hypothetical protein
MLRRTVVFLLVIVGIVGGAEPIAPKKRIKLFNGRDLTNFYTFLEHSKYQDPKQVFTVKGGVLHISGEEWGGLTTKDAFRDYHLLVEWKWGEKTWGTREGKARDSGILLHGTGPDEGRRGYWFQSIEYQIIEGGTGDFIMVDGAERPWLGAEVREEPNGQIYWEKGGKFVRTDRKRINWYGRSPEWKDVYGFRGARDVERPAGEWNVSEVLCDGDTITAIVNGRVVNYGTQASQSAGKLLIQSEGAEVFVRRFEVRPVTKKLRSKYSAAARTP